MNIKKTAIDFLHLVSSGKVQEAFDKYIADNFIHHNPYYEGTGEALLKGMIGNHKEHPNMVLEIKHSVCEEDYVAVHSKIMISKDFPMISVVHLFRFKNEKIVELWDIGIQEPQNNPNKNGLF